MLGKLAFVAIFFKSAGHSNHPELLLSTGLSVPTQMAKAKKISITSLIALWIDCLKSEVLEMFSRVWPLSSHSSLNLPTPPPQK